MMSENAINREDEFSMPSATPVPPQMQDVLDHRNQQIADAASPLPGAVAYDNERPINVPGRFDGNTIYHVMCESHPHISAEEWQRLFALGRIRQHGEAVLSSKIVRGGERLWHVFPDSTEPDVNASIQIVWEDNAIIVVNKPAPLPLHPSGRFNKNSLTSIMQLVYEGELRPAHRLDANTTGLIVLARSAKHAQIVQSQFELGSVEKIYLARCCGHHPSSRFQRDDPIGKNRGAAGLRSIDASGKPSRTLFSVTQRHDNGTMDVHAKPMTGRTNQIRIHLWAAGYPVLGDPLYLVNHQTGNSQTIPLGSPPMCLHAMHLSFTHPSTEQPIVFSANSPCWASPDESTDSN